MSMLVKLVNGENFGNKILHERHQKDVCWFQVVLSLFWTRHAHLSRIFIPSVIFLFVWLVLLKSKDFDQVEYTLIFTRNLILEIPN